MEMSYYGFSAVAVLQGASHTVIPRDQWRQGNLPLALVPVPHEVCWMSLLME